MTTLNTTGKILRKKIRVGRGIGSDKVAFDPLQNFLLQRQT
jgi:hypothetical protein